MAIKRCKCGFGWLPHGDKYCKLCSLKVLKKMRQDGYLTTVPHRSADRSADAQEDVDETNSGIDDKTI